MIPKMTPKFKVPNSIDTIDHARYINRFNQATIKQNALYNTYLQSNGYNGWSPEGEKAKLVERQKHVPNNHILSHISHPMFVEENNGIKKRSLGQHFGQLEMNDPQIRSHLKSFLD